MSSMKQAPELGLNALKLFWPIVLAYLTFQLISDVTAAKITAISIATFSVTVFYFPVTYVISDVLTEVYGYERARRALWLVMACSITAGLVYQFVVWLPPAPAFGANEAFTTVFQQVPRVLVFGWIAVFVGDIANNYLMSKIKIATKGRWLWLRTISSTIVGQGLNTTIFYFGALSGVLPINILLSAIMWGWLAKVAIEVALTPVTYMVVGWVKRTEGIDVYDYNADYNPVKL